MNDVAFLGPKAENADLLERLLLEVLHDYAFWRRNFHPTDPRLITESARNSEAYRRAEAHLRDELFQILDELKRGAPLYSPRQLGHMVSDPALPAIVGYFAGLLYNQNNVVAEAAPETVRKERAYVAALARMIGFPPLLPDRLPKEVSEARSPYAWGHLASGGTVANIEALWLARNVQLFPLAVRLLAATDPAFKPLGELEVAMPADGPGSLSDTRTFELLNLAVPDVTDLHLRIRAWLRAGGPERTTAFEAALPSVRKAGLAGLLLRYNNRFPGDPLRPPIVFISQAAHYGWAKAMDVVGLGAAALRKLPVDEHLRLDVDALAEAVRATAGREEAALMVISICGTTEEGAVDPVHRVETLREELAADGLTFWHHVDGAFGGYLAAMLPRDEAGRAFAYDETEPTSGLLSEEVYRAVAALAEVDSVTIDPHKWGFVPYPAGALLCRDYHVRDAVSYAAPYLPADEQDGFGGFLGQWTLEGSRPGASAVSAYLSQAVLPLEPGGHGELVRRGVAGTRTLVESLRDAFSSGPISCRMLAEPDSVGFCFALVAEAAGESLAEVNAFNRSVLKRLTIDDRSDPSSCEFVLSKLEVPIGLYRHVLRQVLPNIADRELDEATVTFLRCFAMSPFIAAWNEHPVPFARRFAETVYRIAEDVLEAGTFQPYPLRGGANAAPGSAATSPSARTPAAPARTARPSR